MVPPNSGEFFERPRFPASSVQLRKPARLDLSWLSHRSISSRALRLVQAVVVLARIAAAILVESTLCRHHELQSLKVGLTQSFS